MRVGQGPGIDSTHRQSRNVGRLVLCVGMLAVGVVIVLPHRRVN
jgi:hypothetical protein